MPKDLLKGFLKATARLLKERAAIVDRLEVLDEILTRSRVPTITEHPLKNRKNPAGQFPPESSESPRRVRASQSSQSQPAIWQVNQEFHHFPVAMFPFPARAESAFERDGIIKLGQLHNVEASSLGGKNIGKGTLQCIIDLIDRINRGDLSFPEDQSVPTGAFVQLVDSGLSALESPVAIAVQRRLGTDMTLEAIGSEMNLTRERVRQMESLGVAQLSRIHGAKFFQIGKELGLISKERLIQFQDISDSSHTMKFSEEFYITVFHRMFPGLRVTAKNDKIVPLVPTPVAEPPSSTELRHQIFGGETATH